MKKSTVVLLVLAAIPGASFGQDFHRYSFEGGGGLSFPTGSAGNRLNTGYNFLLGGGWNFNQRFGAMLDFQYDHFSLTTGTLQAFNQPDGYNRFWSLTLNPRYYFRRGSKIGGYGTAGYGLYGRTLAFTDPNAAQGYCDPYYGCYSGGTPVIASYTNYHGGVNVGGGLTYALGETGLSFVTDVRYNHFFAHANNSFVTLSFGILY